VIHRSHIEKQLLESLRDAAPAESVLRHCADPERCTQLYRGLLLRAAVALRNGAALAEAHLASVLLDVPDPERFLLHLDRFIEASFNPAGILEDLFGRPALLAQYARLVASSGWLADTLVREARLFRWLFESGVLEQQPSRPALRRAAENTMQRFARSEQRLNALRRFQRRELLRIAAADLLGRKDLGQVLAELSALADAVVGCVLAEAQSAVRARPGADHEPAIAVIALGKLGGEELNYSSDIDLMIVYAPPSADEAHAFAVATVREMLRMLTAVTPEGMLYRTDLRLRPDGASGALAMSLPATVTYYESRGQLWERQMLLRARICAGDAEFGRRVLAGLRPFVYPRTATRMPSELTADIQTRLAERWKEDRNVKHMRGGIRQIEFSLQVLQLLHAPRLPQLRTPSTLRSIAVLAEAELLTLEEEALLRDAYLFLRRIEHLLQLEAFEQTHTIPDDETALGRLAWAAGFSSGEEFARRLSRVRDAVVRICSGLLPLSGGDEARPDIPSAFRDPQRARKLLDELRQGRSSRPRSRGERERMHALIPVIAGELTALPLPDDALAALEQFVHRSASASAVVGLLEQEPARALLLRLASLAPLTLRELETDPLALELVFTGYDAATLTSRRLAVVRRTHAMADFLFGESDLDGCSKTLTETADMLLQRALIEHAAEPPPFVVLAMGKYGGGELIPGSDLDVIFIFDGQEAGAQENAQTLARRCITAMRGDGGGAPLYEVDARLRPEGRNAPLAVSRDAWLRYMETRASLWELQSLLRARPAAGDADLAARLREDIAAMHARFILTSEHVESIRAMRAQMEPQSRFRQRDFLDIKRSAGGMVDAEFAAQLLFLSIGSSAIGAASVALQDLRGRAVADPDLLGRMATTYAFLRRLQLSFRVLLDMPGNLFPDDADARERLAAVMDMEGGDALFDHTAALMRRNRKDFNALCDYLSHRSVRRTER